jgi:predicted exporter
VDQLRDGAISRIVMIGIDGADAASRAAISRELAEALRRDARFTGVANGAAANFERERELLFDHRYVLSAAVKPQRFTVEGLRAAISETLDMLASPAGLMLKALVPRDPTGEMLAVIDQVRPPHARLPGGPPHARLPGGLPEGPGMSEGVWAAPDGQRALLLARTRASGSDTDAQAQAVAAVEEAFRKAIGAVGGPAAGASLVVSGPGVFSVRARAMVERDVVRLTTLSGFLVVALLLAVYRSPRALVLGFVPVVSGALAGVAAVSLGFGTVHGITLGFGTTLIGEAIDYSIYLFVQAEGGRASGDASWVARFWPTIRLGVLTSIAGFSALLFSGLTGLAQLGLYSIVGLVTAAAVTRFVLPALLPRDFRVRDLSALGRRLAAACRAATRLRWVVPAVAVASIAVAWTHRATLWDTELSSLNPITMRDRAIDTELRAALGASDARTMIAVRGATAEEALQAAEAIGTRLDALVAGGKLGGYESPARFLPSAATQRARLASIPDAATLRERLRSALAGLPLRAERLEPFIEDAGKARSRPLLARESIAGSALELALDGLLFPDSSGRWVAMLGLRPPPGGALDEAAVRAALAESRAGDAMVLDLKAEVDRLYAGYFHRALTMSGVGFAVIVMLLFGALRSPARVAHVMAPFVVGILAVAAWHVLGGTRLSIFHLVGLLLVAAVGSNYSLFFDRMGERNAGDVERTLASLALANITAVIGFGILALSSIPVLKAIGSTVALGTLLTLLFAGMTARFGPRYNPPRENTT